MFDDVVDLERSSDPPTQGTLIGGIDQHLRPQPEPARPGVPEFGIVLATAAPANQGRAAGLHAVLHQV
jgi:hypothetical protein